MKKIVILLVSLFSYLNVFSQVRMDVWNKNPNTSRTVSSLKPSKFPKTFESRLPDGTTEIYDKWDVPTIEVETSKGKKYSFKPNAYKGRKALSYLTYTDGGWEGYYESERGKGYSMSPDKITEDTLDLSKIGKVCELAFPPQDLKINKPVGKSRIKPEMAQLVRTDYYNQSIPINKNLTVFAEVTNDVHLQIGLQNVPGFPQSVSVAKTQAWVTNAFLGVAAVYALEGLTVVLNKIYIWETKDNLKYEDWWLGPRSPYGSGPVGLLSAFGTDISQNIPVNPNNTTTGVTSHFKHLLHGNPGYGGIAYIGGNSDGYNLSTNSSVGGFSYALSAVKNFTLPSDPTNLNSYNWPIYVLSHEMGHNCGSKHTQWHQWRNDANVLVGRLDSCYVCEGSSGQSTSVTTPAGSQFGSPCTNAPCAPNCGSTNWTTIKVPGINGTIMSYCHVNGTVISARGFGRYPRFAIRNAVDLSVYIPYSNVVVPTVTTTSPVTSITSTTATAGGNVTNNGGGNILSRGVCWAVSPTTPTTSNSTTNDGVATGSYTSSLTGLAAGTTYNLRAYATNSAGTSYGSTVTFTTSAATIPTLTTTAISSITQTTASSGGTISSDGGSSISSKGVCWSTSPSPTTALTTKTSNGTGTATFTSSITGLIAGTTYYVRAYAVNSLGTAYGNEIIFTASPIVSPTLTTTSVTTFTNTTATMGGNVTATGGGTVTARGVCYATTTNPDLTKSVVTIGSGIGTFSQSVTGLTQGVLYYVRAYATNSAGTNYGTQVSFRTLTSPTVTTTSASNITVNSATSGGNVTSAGGGTLTVTGRGICYATTTNPTVLNTTISAGTGTGAFTSNITGLSQGVLYYVRAYATNTYGTSYGSQISFRTLNVPTVTTTSATSVTQTSASTGGNVTSAGGGTLTVTDRGVCYSTSTNPTITNGTVVSSGTGTGTYTVSLTGLTPGTVYYARAYATNSLGTGYGSQITITTSNVPVLTTTTVTSISTSGATSGGNISSSSGSSVTARGVCYSTSPNPTIANSITSNGTGTGTFTSTITGLSPSTTYFVRAYATNTSGTGYGNELSFTTTSSGTVPSLTTTTVTGISQTTASSGGNVTSDGGFAVTARGICYATTQNPTTGNTVVSAGSGTGSFTSSLTGLIPSTTYYVRAFATNSNGTNYGSQVSFTTLATNTIPTVTTTSVTSVTSTTAATGGNVTSAGGLTVTARGICYATTTTPTIANTVITSGTGTGSFSVSITSLTPGTTYYVRAYATNSLGTSYGGEVSFTTLIAPSLTTTNASSITSTSATTGGNVTSSGGTSVTARGVCYATTQNPTLSNLFTSDGTGTGSFTSNLSGLSENTTYYVRAYATNSVGTSFGSQVSFTTSSGVSLPTVTTTAVSSITPTSAVSGGNVTSGGSQSVTSRGVCWSTSPEPTIALSTKTSNGTGTGVFTSTLTPLLASTTYYVRAYATSSVGTAYGSEITFTTSAQQSNICTVNNLSAYKSGSLWYYKWDINANCNSYTVSLSKYSYQDINTQPPSNATPVSTGIRLTNYVPTPAEITQGFVNKQMASAPQSLGFWYSVDVKCNATTCSGSNTTKSFFWVQ